MCSTRLRRQDLLLRLLRRRRLPLRLSRPVLGHLQAQQRRQHLVRWRAGWSLRLVRPHPPRLLDQDRHLSAALGPAHRHQLLLGYLPGRQSLVERHLPKRPLSQRRPRPSHLSMKIQCRQSRHPREEAASHQTCSLQA